MMRRFVLMVLGAVFVWAIATQSLLAAPVELSVQIATVSNGAKLFEANCAGCHINGGNIIRRGKTLQLKALQRNGYDTVEKIATLVTNGKGNMSAYRDRLTPAEINTVATYVLDQANTGWKKNKG